MNVDEQLSPALQEKVTYLGTVLSSFPAAERAVEMLLERLLGIKRIERLTERIGAERVAQRDAEAVAWERRPLMEKLAAPPGVKPPAVAAVFADGGRLQLRDKKDDSSTHWGEYKAGCLLELSGSAHEHDPCPDVPALFLARERVETLSIEIGKKAADMADASCGACPPEAQDPGSAHYEPPAVLSREVVATRRNSGAFGKLLAARVWHLGMCGASRKAYLGDGQNWIWTLWERHFQPFGFVAILDVIHALTYVFAAATAGRSRETGWGIYVRWIGWVWRGEGSRVIAELAVRQDELGLPTEEDGPTSVRRIVSEALTYLQNQQSRMNYPHYRRLGLPLTSSHIESTVKLLNRRVKGSEKFWSETGAEALLQLKADTLSDTQPLERFWRERPTRATGTRNYSPAAA